MKPPLEPPLEVQRRTVTVPVSEHPNAMFVFERGDVVIEVCSLMPDLPGYQATMMDKATRKVLCECGHGSPMEALASMVWRLYLREEWLHQCIQMHGIDVVQPGSDLL